MRKRPEVRPTAISDLLPSGDVNLSLASFRLRRGYKRVHGGPGIVALDQVVI